MLNLVVKDIMNSKVRYVSPDTHLQDVLVTMNTAGFRHLPVVGDDVIVGIITDRDLRLTVDSPMVDDEIAISREKILDATRVRDCMTPNPMCVSSDTSARDVAELLCLHKFGALPVVDSGKLVGMIRYIDYLQHYAASG